MPDMNRMETRMGFYFPVSRYIDAGKEAIHFGQLGLMDTSLPPCPALSWQNGPHSGDFAACTSLPLPGLGSSAAFPCSTCAAPGSVALAPTTVGFTSAQTQTVSAATTIRAPSTSKTIIPSLGFSRSPPDSPTALSGKAASGQLKARDFRRAAPVTPHAKLQPET